uniref:Uncharacterized protein n=1 Tax=Nomascus leucogenys TaxID=61853 RepID=A0A2I3HYI6_NOMLE
MPLLLQCNDPGYVQDILWLSTELLLPLLASSTLSPFISKVRPNDKTFLKKKWGVSATAARKADVFIVCRNLFVL